MAYLKNHLQRRAFLKSASYGLALPFLPSLRNSVWADEQQSAKVSSGDATGHAKRLVCMGSELSFYRPDFRADSENPRLLQPLYDGGLGSEFTTFSGLDHKGPSGGGHAHVNAFLRGTVDKHISFDRIVAPHLGRDTRYESMELSAGEGMSRSSLSFTEGGIPIPVISRPSIAFARIFGGGSLGVERQRYVLDTGSSLLDDLSQEASSLRASINREDQRKLDEYLSSVRDIEGRMQRQKEWLEVDFPEPDASFQLPREEVIAHAMVLENEALMWDLIAMAIVNDSCRVFTFSIPRTYAGLVFNGEFRDISYHKLSHHKGKKEVVDSFVEIQMKHMECITRFCQRLKDTPDPDGGNMFDSTVTLVGSGMGDSSSHKRIEFPLLLAGGGFNHQGHVACGTPETPNEMACDLFVTMMQRLGLEVDQFSSSQSNLNEVLL